MVLDTNIVTTFLQREARARTPKLVEFVEASLLAEGIAISFVTQFELRRGLEDLARRGEGRRKLVTFEKFMLRVVPLGLDAGSGAGWNLAAQLWADGRAMKPALVFSEADLLVAATAAFHRRDLATCDRDLAAGLARLAAPLKVHLIPVA